MDTGYARRPSQRHELRECSMCTDLTHTCTYNPNTHFIYVRNINTLYSFSLLEQDESCTVLFWVCSCVQYKFTGVLVLNIYSLFIFFVCWTDIKKKLRLHREARHIWRFLCDIWGDACKVWNTSVKQGQVTKDEVTYPFSANSVFLNPRTSFKGVWDWIPGQVQSPVSYSVSSLCVCMHIPVCLNFRTI